MKRVSLLLLVLAMVFAAAACGKGDDGKKNESSGGNQTSDNQNPGQTADDPSGASGSDKVLKVTGDAMATVEGTQAHDAWHAVTYTVEYEFDTDGRCTVNQVVYTLDDPANYETVNTILSGGWEPVWSLDKDTFTLASSMKDYTETTDAIEYFTSRYFPYTVTYGDGSIKRFNAPDDAEAAENMKSLYGFSFDQLNPIFGDFTYVSRTRDSAKIRRVSETAVEDANSLCESLLLRCKGYADDSLVYGAKGKAEDPLADAPVISAKSDKAEFIYYRGGREIKVSIAIDTKPEDAITVSVSVAK